MTGPNWLIWARELQAIAQTGLAYYERPVRPRSLYPRPRDRGADDGRAGRRDIADIEGCSRPRAAMRHPKVGVRAAVFREDGAILMVREMTDGRWALPGGWADVNQSPRESVAREVREETGFEVVPRKLAAVFDRAESPHGRRAGRFTSIDCSSCATSPAARSQTSYRDHRGSLFRGSPNCPPICRRTAARVITSIACSRITGRRNCRPNSSSNRACSGSCGVARLPE